MRNLLPIGRFSKICKLTVKALRHYDETGLLRPAQVDPETGYRYYSFAQASEAERIRQLRQLDMPLEDIRRVMRQRDIDTVRPILDQHRERIEARMRECERVLGFIERLMSQEEGIMPYEVNVKETNQQTVLSLKTKTTLSSLHEVFGAAFGELFGYLGQLGEAPIGPPLTLYHGEFHEDDMDIEICIPTARKLAGKGRLEGQELPGGPVAFTLHAGAYSEIGPAYQAIASWMQEHGHESAGAPREIYLVGPGQAQDEEDFRTELAWPLKG